MFSRRDLLRRAGVLAVAGGGLLLLRETVLWPPPRAVFGAGDWSGWLPLAPRAGIPVIEAVVEGHRLSALVDSGAERSVIDEALAARLGITGGFSMPIIAFGIGGGAQVGKSVRTAATLGDLTLNSLTLARLDLSPLSAAGAGEVGVVLGQDVLGQLLLDLDWPRRRLALRPKAAVVDGARSLMARKQGRTLHATVAVEGMPIEALVDTGSSSILAISSEAADKAGLLGDDHPFRFNRTVTFGGGAAGKEITVESLRFGDEDYGRAEVEIYASERGGLIPPALVGSGALLRRRVLIGLGDGRLEAAP